MPKMETASGGDPTHLPLPPHVCLPVCFRLKTQELQYRGSLPSVPSRMHPTAASRETPHPCLTAQEPCSPAAQPAFTGFALRTQRCPRQTGAGASAAHRAIGPLGNAAQLDFKKNACPPRARRRKTGRLGTFPLSQQGQEEGGNRSPVECARTDRHFRSYHRDQRKPRS